MEFDETSRRMIAEAVRDRRAHLGLSQEEAASRSGGMISTANLRVFEGAGRATYRTKSLIGVARAMAWPDDAIEQIARGADFRTLPTVEGGAATPAAPAAAPAAPSPVVGGVELATVAQLDELRREVDAQRAAIDEMSRRLVELARRAGAPRSDQGADEGSDVRRGETSTTLR